MNGSRLPKKSTLLIWPHRILRLLTIISFVILHRGSCVMGCGSSLPFRSICNCYVFPRDIMNWQSWHGHHIYFVLLSRVSNSMQSARYCFYHFCLSVSLSVRHICGIASKRLHISSNLLHRLVILPSFLSHHYHYKIPRELPQQDIKYMG